jgi:hypothetical protein
VNVTFDPPARGWAPQILSSLAPGADQLRIPLAVFFCEAVRRELESELESRGHYPQWDAARPALDGAGRLARIVPLVTGRRRDLFDEQFG